MEKKAQMTNQLIIWLFKSVSYLRDRWCLRISEAESSIASKTLMFGNTCTVD